MRFSLKPILFPLLVIVPFFFAVYWLATRQYDRGFACVVAVGSAIAAVIGNALYVYSTDNRIRDIEAKLERLYSKSLDDQFK